MKILSIAFLAIASLVGALPAMAADITNADKKAVVIDVVENGNRSKLPLSPGTTESICSSGCFITAPNGDRIGLSGGETVKISGGAVIVN
ncbi:hypothetical protein [Rhizobium sp. C1]|uniref:hypothetical protein n=1 Tax=Rhizobium sp. C1 TaxID=1349799 RepID=UPI001E3AFCD7|nr:hypothetical protein [Rhizobium sp. C1]MCD2176651.1 hypothetical protein [Rhizobium sp. C1]